MIRWSGLIVNRSGFIRAGINGSRAWVGYGNIFEDKLEARAGRNSKISARADF
jgi:hypothetical protein